MSGVEGRRSSAGLPFSCCSGLAGGGSGSGFALEDGQGLLDDGGELFEVLDQGHEVGVDPGVSGEVEAFGADGALRSRDESFDVGDHGGEAGDEGLLEGLGGLEDAVDAEGEASNGFHFAGEPLTEIRDFDAEFLDDVHKVLAFLCMQK